MPLLNSSFSQALFIARFGQAEWLALTDRALNNNDTDQATINALRQGLFQAAVDDSVAEVNSQLGERLNADAPVPDIILVIVADLVRARLYADSPTPQINARQNKARQILQELALKRRQLGTTGSTPTEMAIRSPHAVFHDDNLKAY